MEYKLIALDMDGTLLDSDKKIRNDSLKAIELAVSQGKYVCLSTGRNMAEIDEYLGQLGKMQYLMCISGALIIDNSKKAIAYKKSLEEMDILSLFEISRRHDALVHIHSDRSHMERKSLDIVHNYGMGQYVELFKRSCIFHDDMEKEYKENHFPVYKFNFYCRNTKVRTEIEEEVKKLPVARCYAETKSLECSPLGISKASGLRELCKYLNISTKEAIAVGDSDNDVDILKEAGLGIAMGNAKENVKEIAGAVVSDCDSTGIKEAIENYLLK